jgi:subtilisin family serine protease
MRKAVLLPFVATFVLASCSDIEPPTAPAADGAGAPTVSAGGIPGQYIVVLRGGAADPRGLADQFAAANGASVRYVYTNALRGFTLSNLPEPAVAALQRNPAVAYIEQDQVVTLSATQNSPTWGLDRIDQRTLPLSSSYTYDQTGAGVRAYVIDTGIRRAHQDFGGRAVTGFDAITSGGSAEDCNGHGSHVAGTVGGSVYGVAKGATLVAVRVLDCGGSGTNAGVIAGVDWVTGNHVKPAVANMSLGGGASTALDDAVRRSITAGVTYVVAAGNGDFIGRQQPACNYSPARVREALTVGATNSSDAKASWSNYGECVDIFAPGVSITSAWYTSNTATNTISGTSMAAPHVAGVAALYLQANPTASAATVFSAIVNGSTKNIVTSSSTTNNHLLYSRLASGTTPVNQPPVANFTYTCGGLTCNFTDTSTDDGGVVSRAWTFGDGASSSATNPTHTYGSAGTRSVTLTVTDAANATNSKTQSVTVTAPSSSTLTLVSVTAYKVKGAKHADLTWSPSVAVDVYRDNTVVGPGISGPAWTHSTTEKGGGSHTYKVCNAGTQTCSNEITVTY